MYFKKTLLAVLVAAAGSASAVPALDSTTALTTTGSLATTSESTNPFLLAAGWKQELVVDYNTLSAQFAANGETYPATFHNWDMIDFGGANNEFIYIPHEVGPGGAGVTRYNRSTGDAIVLLQGNNSTVFESNPAVWSATNDDFGGIDPAVTTPTGSLVVAEEWSGNGRMFELVNPTTATGKADAQWQWLSNIPSVSHEGVKFDSAGNMYFVDENNSGSIYKFVPKTPGDYTVGQTFVLSADGFSGDAAATYSSADTRTGAASWVAMTDADGNALTGADPFDFTNRGGRTAADELNGTPYGRPEDLEIGVLGNGNEVLYFATTSENVVYSVDLGATGDSPIIAEFLNSGVTLDHSGSPVGTGNPSDSTYGLDDPDNLAIDADGNVYIIEDENPGDIWQAIDSDMDGIADVVGLLASLGPFGSEPTGFIMDPNDPNAFYVNIQHPDSGNDALWKLSHVPTPSAALLLLAGLPLVRRFKK